MIRAAVLTASDRSFSGEREDASGALLEEKIREMGGSVLEKVVVSDEKENIESEIIRLVDQVKVDLVLTTGGTGLAPRDQTPDATRAVMEREVPGMAEAMRAASLEKTPHAMLSRAVCGIRGSALIINLPGSPKAVEENFLVVSRSIPHALETIKGEVTDCHNNS